MALRRKRHGHHHHLLIIGHFYFYFDFLDEYIMQMNLVMNKSQEYMVFI